MDHKIQAPGLPWETSMRYDAFVIGLFVLMLLVGSSFKSWVEARTNIFTDLDADLSLSYPELWTTKVEKGTLLSIRDMQSEGTFKTMFSVNVQVIEQPENTSLQDLLMSVTADRDRELSSYQVLEKQETQLDNLDAVRVLYAYVDNPPVNPLQTYLPTVVKAVDLLVIRSTKLYIFTFAAPAVNFSQEVKTLEAILRSVDFKQEG